MGNSWSSSSADTSMGNSWSSSLAGTAIKVVAAAAALGLAAWIFASSSSSPSANAHRRNQQQKSAATVSAQQIHLQQEQDEPKPAPYDCLQGGKAEVGEEAETIPVAASSGPAFIMSVPEDSLELDDDDDDDEMGLSSTPLTTAEDGSDTQMAVDKFTFPEAEISEKPHTSSVSVDSFSPVGRPCAPSSFHFYSPIRQNPVTFGEFSSLGSWDGTGDSSGRNFMKVKRNRIRRKARKG